MFAYQHHSQSLKHVPKHPNLKIIAFVRALCCVIANSTHFSVLICGSRQIEFFVFTQIFEAIARGSISTIADIRCQLIYAFIVILNA